MSDTVQANKANKSFDNMILGFLASTQHFILMKKSLINAISIADY